MQLKEGHTVEGTDVLERLCYRRVQLCACPIAARYSCREAMLQQDTAVGRPCCSKLQLSGGRTAARYSCMSVALQQGTGVGVPCRTKVQLHGGPTTAGDSCLVCYSRVQLYVSRATAEYCCREATL